MNAIASTFHESLQWGRNFIVAETSIRIDPFILLKLTSMGPQLYRCGNLYGGVSGGIYHGLLQWGRNFIVAETSIV